MGPAGYGHSLVCTREAGTGGRSRDRSTDRSGPAGSMTVGLVGFADGLWDADGGKRRDRQKRAEGAGRGSP